MSLVPLVIKKIVPYASKLNLGRKIFSLSPELLLLLIPVAQFILEQRAKRK